MTKLIVKSSGARLRKTPDTSTPANIVTGLPFGMGLEGDLSDGWYEVATYIHSSVVNILPDLPVPPEGAVPYRSQWDTDASSRGADCGQTTVAMLTQWRGISVDIDDLRFQSSTNGLTTGADLVRNFASIGLSAVWRYLSGAETPPLNSICLVRYDGFDRSSVQDRNYRGWHWIILLQIDPDFVTVHDPDYWGARRREGAFKRYSRREWNAAFIPSGTGRVIVYLT